MSLLVNLPVSALALGFHGLGFPLLHEPVFAKILGLQGAPSLR